MKLTDEDVSKVLVSDLPEQSEYRQILHDSHDAGRLVNTDFEKCQELSTKSWRDISDLAAACIARGIRLAKEGERGKNKKRKEGNDIARQPEGERCWWYGR